MDWILIAVLTFFLMMTLLNYLGLLDILELVGGIFGLLFALIGLIFALLTRGIRRLTLMIDSKKTTASSKDGQPRG